MTDRKLKFKAYPVEVYDAGDRVQIVQQEPGTYSEIHIAYEQIPALYKTLSNIHVEAMGEPE